MKFKFLLLTLGLFTLASLPAQAQFNNEAAPLKQEKEHKSPVSRNFFKVNLTSILFNNYALQYERVLNKRFSIALSGRLMPEAGIPFRKKILDAVVEEGDTEAENFVRSIRLSNYAITPELRIYLGKKGYGRGFYLAPFYRYAHFEAKNAQLTYTDDNDEDATIDMTGKLSAHTGGLLIGAQWALGKHICLDWWILGAHYGSGKGDFAGISSQPLSANEQADLRTTLEDLDIPLTDKTINVNANGASLKLDGPWAGLRAGLSIGFKF